MLVVPLDAAGSISFAERVIADVKPRLIVGDSTLLAKLRTANETKVDRLAFAEMSSRLPAEPDFRVCEAVR